MSFLRTEARSLSKESVIERRYNDFNSKPVGRRSYCWDLDAHGVEKLVICDKRIHTPQGVKLYISVRHLTFKPKLLARSHRRHGYTVNHEECFLPDHAKAAMRCFLQRKWSPNPKEVTGTGLTLAAISALLMATQTSPDP